MVSGLLSQGSEEDVVGRSGWLCECVVVWRWSAEVERVPAEDKKAARRSANGGGECHLWHPLRRDWWSHNDPRVKFLTRTLWSDQAVAVAF